MSASEPNSRMEEVARQKAAAFRSRQTVLPDRRTFPPPLPRASSAPPPLPTQVKKSDSKETIMAKSLLNEAELAHYKNLTVFAKTLVESHFSGKHKSPDIGGGGEFIEFKHYEPGLSVEAIDWKIFAATKKLLIRTYREETDMAIHLLVDASGSMGFLGKGKEMKGSRAARIAAALGYLTMRQGDDVSLTLFADAVLAHKPAGRSKRHLAEIMRTLIKPAFQPQGRTDPAGSLRASARLLKRKGKLVIISDFLGCDCAAMLDEAGRFTHRGYEVMLMQVRDPDEVLLPDISIARLVDMETNETVEVEPEEIRRDYQRDMKDATRQLSTECSRRGISFAEISNHEPYRDSIERYLGFRGGRMTNP